MNDDAGLLLMTSGKGRGGNTSSPVSFARITEAGNRPTGKMLLWVDLVQVIAAETDIR